MTPANSAELPHVIAQWAQPTTPAPVEGLTRTSILQSLAPNEVGFLGELVAIRGKALVAKHSVPAVSQSPRSRAILGTEGITVTSGYGKWKNIDRRQRVGITILEGYDPYTITVPLILDGLTDLESVEENVSKIEWMGGRGLLFGTEDSEKQKVFVPGQGETPIVEIFGPLVPPECSNGNIRFVVTAIEYNMAGRELILPIRRPDGERVRQALTLTLTQYIPAKGASQSAASKLATIKQEEHEYKHFVVSDGINTFRKIAKHFGNERIVEAAREIQKANPKLGASIEKHLAHGTRVKVPLSATRERA